MSAGIGIKLVMITAAIIYTFNQHVEITLLVFLFQHQIQLWHGGRVYLYVVFNLKEG